MTYEIKPLSCNPTQLKGLSEKLIVSHYENNYSGAVKRLNAITAQLESLDFSAAPVFVINGLKREELNANNSMILHELYFDSRGKMANPVCCRRLHEQYQLGSALYWNQVRT
jgi:Fe-Mn family superoxide dismutase